MIQVVFNYDGETLIEISVESVPIVGHEVEISFFGEKQGFPPVFVVNAVKHKIRSGLSRPEIHVYLGPR